MSIKYELVTSEMDKLLSSDSDNGVNVVDGAKLSTKLSVNSSANKSKSSKFKNGLGVDSDEAGKEVNSGDKVRNLLGRDGFKMDRMGRMYNYIRRLRNDINRNDQNRGMNSGVNVNVMADSKSNGQSNGIVFHGDSMGINGTVGFVVRHNLSKSDFSKMVPGWKVMRLNSSTLRNMGVNVLSGFMSVENGKFVYKEFDLNSGMNKPNGVDNQSKLVKDDKDGGSDEVARIVSDRLFFVYSPIYLGEVVNNPSKLTEFVNLFNNVLPYRSDKAYILFAGEWISKNGLNYWVDLIRMIDDSCKMNAVDNGINTLESMVTNVLRRRVVQNILSVNMTMRILTIRCQMELESRNGDKSLNADQLNVS